MLILINVEQFYVFTMKSSEYANILQVTASLSQDE
jgi:hypothetical protein